MLLPAEMGSGPLRPTVDGPFESVRQTTDCWIPVKDHCGQC